jgi:hypothetical protein
VGRINIGPNSVPAVGYLNGDTLIDMIVGIKRGGVALFYGSDDISLSIGENLPDTKFSCYPNPVKNQLTIKSASLTLLNSDYTLYDYSGKIIERGVLISDTLTVSHLAEGLYFLLIEQNNALHTLKFVKE